MPDPMTPPKGQEPKKPNDQTQPGGGSSPDMGKGMNPEPNRPEAAGIQEGDERRGHGRYHRDAGSRFPAADGTNAAVTRGRKAQQERGPEFNRNWTGIRPRAAMPSPTQPPTRKRIAPTRPQSKPQPPQNGMGMEPQPKPEPKSDGAKPMPMGGDNNAPSQSKPEGKPEEKPNPDSAAKPGHSRRVGILRSR